MKNYKVRIPKFTEFIINESNRVDEGFIKDAIKKVKSWAELIYQRISDGLVKLIPSGPKKGLPIYTLFDISKGKIIDQVNDFYSGTEFAKTNPKSLFENKIEYTDIDAINEAAVPLTYTGEDQSVRNVGAPELSTMVQKLYRSKSRGGRAKPIFIFGAPGIGKTQIVAGAADILGVSCLYLDLLHMAPEDLIGIPVTIELEAPERDAQGRVIDGEDGKPKAGKGVTRSNPPIILPTTNGTNGKGGIIFLDELNRANQIVFTSCMQFIQSGRLGEYQLPDKWIIVAAGNRESEAQVTEFDFALADRFSIVNLVPKVEDWVIWNRKKNLIPEVVVSFVERNQEMFHHLDTDKKTLSFPSPRSWMDAGLILMDEIEDEGVNSWMDLPLQSIYNIFADQVGPEAAALFKAYLQVISKLTEKDLEMITTDAHKAPLVTGLSKKADELYGISEMAMKKAIELSKNGTPSAIALLNILEYFDRYQNLEQLTWIYQRIIEQFPDFKITSEVLDTKDSSEESKAKIKAGSLVNKGAKGKGLI